MLLEKQLKNVFIKHDKVTGEVIPQNAPKQYLILVVYNDDTECKTFELFIGREDVTEYLVANIDQIDILKTHVMSETMTLKNAVTAYSFLRVIRESGVELEIDPDEFLDEGVDGDTIYNEDNKVE